MPSRRSASKLLFTLRSGDHAFEYQWHSMQHRRGNDIGSAGSTHINYNFHHADGMTSIMPLMLKRDAGGSQAAESPWGDAAGRSINARWACAGGAANFHFQMPGP